MEPNLFRSQKASVLGFRPRQTDRGCCYFLQEQQDEELNAAVRELVEMINGAQHRDGYLSLHYTVVGPGQRWTNLRDMHEMCLFQFFSCCEYTDFKKYDARHLIKAALIHHLHYKNTLFLDPMLKYVELMHKTFGPGPDQIRGYPGYPEIE